MLLDRLRKYSNANPANVANVHPQNTPTLATLATLQLATPLESEVISNWWLIHFTDLDPVQVAIWPPCNNAGALASYPKAIAAEPIPSPIDENLNVELMANE